MDQADAGAEALVEAADVLVGQGDLRDQAAMTFSMTAM